MFESEGLEVMMEMKHAIELDKSQQVLMRISRTSMPGECVDVLLKAVHQSDFSWQLLAEYGDQNQNIQISRGNDHGEISTENSVCRRRKMPYINLSQIIPKNWHETREIFRQYKGGEVILNPSDNIEISSPLPNITFMKLESKE